MFTSQNYLNSAVDSPCQLARKTIIWLKLDQTFKKEKKSLEKKNEMKQRMSFFVFFFAIKSLFVDKRGLEGNPINKIKS
jgi:hypothetical protein